MLRRRIDGSGQASGEHHQTGGENSGQMSNPSSPPTSVPLSAAAGAGAMRWLTIVCMLAFLMLVTQVFKADENKRDDISEVKEDFKARRIDGVKRNKRVKLLFRGRPRALIHGFNPFSPKGYEITLPLIKVEQQQLAKKRPVEVDRAINYDKDMGKRYKGSKGALTGPLFAFVNCKFSGGCRVLEDVEQHTIGIYSPRSRCTFTLPPIPGLRTGIPLQCQCVSLHGKLYVLGGLIPVGSNLPASEELYTMFSTRERFIASRDVYVMDLTGSERQWKPLPNVHEPRRKFSVAVCNGKIFVLGGEFRTRWWLYQCEVYDPKVNTWSRIKPMPSPRTNHNVAAIGNKLFVHAGFVRLSSRSPRDADVYDPLQDEWRVAENWLGRRMGAVFVADGRLHAMNKYGIYLSRGVGRWEPFTESGPAFFGAFKSYVTEALDGIHGGLVTLVHWRDSEIGCGRVILQSAEFREHSEVHWEVISSYSCGPRKCEAAGDSPFFCRIVL